MLVEILPLMKKGIEGEAEFFRPIQYELWISFAGPPRLDQKREIGLNAEIGPIHPRPAGSVGQEDLFDQLLTLSNDNVGIRLR